MIPFFFGIIILFVFPLNKKFAYRFVKGECDNKASWIHHRVFEDSTNIDVAFIGASHTSCAIMDEFIEMHLSENTGEPVKVSNLGYCRSGRDIQYVYLKDLFEQKSPKLVVLEVMEDEPKKSHPVFPYLAESGDLLGSFIFFNQRYFSNLFKGLTVRYEQLKYSIFKTNLQENENQADFGYLPSSQVVSEEALSENQRNWQGRLSRLNEGTIREIKLNYSKHYLLKMAELAKENNCEVVFLYLPESGSGLKYPLLTKYYQQLGKLIVLPDSVLANKKNWKDATHFNDLGAQQASEFIASYLNSYFF